MVVTRLAQSTGMREHFWVNLRSQVRKNIRCTNSQLSRLVLKITPIPKVVPHNDLLTALSQFNPHRWQMMHDLEFS